MSNPKLSSISGSAPRVRGTLPPQRQGRRADRFSPAGAGNTLRGAHKTHQRTVQPRGCGEHAVPMQNVNRRSGSAPRVRGTLFDELRTQYEVRFSPAGAGNTHRSWYRRLARTVQPRGCGEHLLQRLYTTYPTGSAPRVRGTLLLVLVDDALRRFSPAGAGNTQLMVRNMHNESVQPRGCGEHLALADRSSDLSGSAPRVRGTHRSSSARERGRRFSPAGAGNTAMCCSRSVSVIGSAPRVRGTLVAVDFSAPVTRFSPAGAGNTSHHSRCRSRAPGFCASSCAKAAMVGLGSLRRRWLA